MAALLATAVIGASAQAIVGGVLDANPLSPYRFVGQLSSGVGGATPIAPQWLITARHINPQVGQTFTNPDGTFTVDQVKTFASPTHPGGFLDFALLHVAGTSGATFTNYYRYAEVYTTAPITLVGYGQTGTPTATGYNAAGNPTNSRYLGYNTIDAAGLTGFGNPPQQDFFAYAYDLDGPTGANTFGGGAIAGEAGSALYDSGSGWFFERNGVPILVATTSGVTNSSRFTYGDIGIGNSVGAYESLIQATTGIGAVAPVPEPASMAALGLGALAMLRRRRKA